MSVLTEDIGLAVPSNSVVREISVVNVASYVDSLLVPRDRASGHYEVLRSLTLDPKAGIVLDHAVFYPHLADRTTRADHMNPHPFVSLNEAVSDRDGVEKLTIDLDSMTA